MRDVRMHVEDFRCVIGPLGNCLISQNENVAFFTSSIVKSKNEDEFNKQLSDLDAYPGDVVTISGDLKEAEETVLGGTFHFRIDVQSMKLLEEERFTIKDDVLRVSQ